MYDFSFPLGIRDFRLHEHFCDFEREDGELQLVPVDMPLICVIKSNEPFTKISILHLRTKFYFDRSDAQVC